MTADDVFRTLKGNPRLMKLRCWVGLHRWENWREPNPNDLTNNQYVPTQYRRCDCCNKYEANSKLR